jgi:multimeric flavodoxin WrbA
MMKILACIGSYRTNGNTARALSLIEEAMRREANQKGETLEFETIYLGHMNIQMCRGCRICFDRGEAHCPLKDDLLAIKAKMKEADGVILASPVYVDDVSGITKNWIDRLAHVCHRPEFAGKYAYLLATTGSTSTGHTLRTMNALMYMGFHIIGRAGFRTGALSKRDEINARYKVEIERIARTIFYAIHRAAAPSFFSFMVFKIQQIGWRKQNPDSIDFRYWEGNGWLDPRRTFYTNQRSNRFKVTLARLVGSAFAPFIT